MANDITTAKVRYKIKDGDTLVIVGCPVKITNANVNTDAIQTILANEGRKSGRDYFKLCLEKA